MSSQAARNAADAVSRRIDLHHSVNGRWVELGIVRRLSPTVEVELTGAPVSLEAGEDLRMTVDVRWWNVEHGLKIGDVLIIVRLEDDSYAAIGVLTDEPVVAVELPDNIVTTSKIANGAVTTPKLADAAVTTLKILDGAVTIAKLSFDPATQAELDVVSAALTTHAALTTTAHGGIVASVNPSILGRGTLAARPAAAAGNLGSYYFATDDTGGKLSRSTGAAWEQISLGLTDSRLTDARTPTAHQATHVAGGTDALPFTTINGKGTLAARPAAGSTNAGYTYFATDSAGGTLYRSTGSAWDQVAAGLTATATPSAHASTHLPAGTDAIDFAGSIIRSGTLAARPAAGATNNGTLYFATDSNGGTLTRSNGSAWSAVAPGLSGSPLAHAASHAPGGADALDYTLVHLIGTLAARPAAAAANNGLLYFATDSAGGTLYRSNASAWVALAPGIAQVNGSAVLAQNGGNINFTSAVTDINSVSVVIGPSGRCMIHIDPSRFINSSGANQAPVIGIYVDGTRFNAGAYYSYVSTRDDLLMLNGTTSICRTYTTLLTGLTPGTRTISWRDVNGAGDGSGSTQFNGGARPVSLIAEPVQ